MSRQPVLFLGHGSPMNAIEDTPFSRALAERGRALGKPSAILMISAHWFVSGLFVNDEAFPRQVYDMYGFPKALYDLKYTPPGEPALAARVAGLTGASINNTWGFDHGMWSVLVHLFPQADIPVVQLSVNRAASPAEHFETGRKLAALRDENVLILGSGNIVHNLRKVNFDNPSGDAWAMDFDQLVCDRIMNRDFAALLDPGKLSEDAQLAIPTPDHYLPLLTLLGAASSGDPIDVFNNDFIYGSLSMTSYQFG